MADELRMLSDKVLIMHTENIARDIRIDECKKNIGFLDDDLKASSKILEDKIKIFKDEIVKDMDIKLKDNLSSITNAITIFGIAFTIITALIAFFIKKGM